ncbi:chromosome partitioning protein ParB [Sporanaerobium hydrogeniformans]|uniref:Chromosome partitioning protein ParB n=1 Tax=Sporanaerobium hydrogeniformans TaxID=3072179 RepID=A0AC61DDA9_9FIRM|nr:ParB/RepB/Spo0J family partition protein [Sporanaerobium hydrogeniformans]PHV70611.1 chromosome partitioning protein ParB [Sporanaerobium hydrogeniformans]
MKQRGLGKGLNALLSDEALNVGGDNHVGVQMVNINDIETNFDQPRKKFNQEELQELSLSIRQHGILQPLIVRKKDNKYEIVAGERRYRAARMAELNEIPIIVKEFDDKQTLEIALIENIQRQDLNAMELACAYNLLMERFDLNQDEVADRVGKSRPSVTNILRLMNLTPYAQEKLRENLISFGHARAILSIKDIKVQKQLVDYIIGKKLSVRETEKYVQGLLNEKEGKKEKKEAYNPFYREIQENLQKSLGTKVTISMGAKKGKIEIEYYSDDELERIISLMHVNK